MRLTAIEIRQAADIEPALKRGVLDRASSGFVISGVRSIGRSWPMAVMQFGTPHSAGRPARLNRR
jgi:hypothetical protein